MNKNSGTLYIVSTPIGNLDDITFRAIELLNNVDICASEDTRVSKRLFKKYNINTKLISYHKFSEKTKLNFFVSQLKSGKDVALISDAGTPLISDPGSYLVDAAISNSIDVIPIPGVTSIIAALSVSGFNIDNFTFYGFFPRKEKDKNKVINKIAISSSPSIIFESGKRLLKFIDYMSVKLEANRQIMIAREISKMHETFYRGNLKDIKNLIADDQFGEKGEFVIIVDSTKSNRDSEMHEEDMRILQVLLDNLDKKKAMEIGSEILNKTRNELYKIKLN